MTIEVIDWTTLRSTDADEPTFDMIKALLRGHKLYDVNHKAIIGTKITPLPTMCGGRYVSIQPYPRTEDVTLVELGPCYCDTYAWWPCHENGLLAIVAECPYNMMQELRDQMSTFCDYISGMGDKEISMDESTGFLEPRPVENDFVKYSWVIALADMFRHENEDYDSGEGECEECGATVYADDEGYCEDCDWHTHISSGDFPEEDHNMGLSGDAVEDYEDHFDFEQTLIECGHDDDDRELRWNGTFWDAGSVENQVRVLSTVVNAEVRAFETTRSKVGMAKKLPINDFIERFLLPACMWRGPVWISSNVAEASYMTPYLIAHLRREKQRLRDYGLKLVAPGHFATNPNERDHYIDGVMIVGLRSAEMNSAYRRAVGTFEG